MKPCSLCYQLDDGAEIAELDAECWMLVTKEKKLEGFAMHVSLCIFPENMAKASS